MIKATLIESMGSDLTTVNAARVSFAKTSEWDTSGDVPTLYKKDIGLTHYLADNKHHTPFGHCFATFHVKAPIFVTRQLVKHEYLRMNEISRRYVDSDPEFFMPDKWRKRPDGSVKQGSSDESIESVLWTHPDGEVTVDDPDTCVHKFYKEAEFLYRSLLNSGVAPEQARMVLPLSMYTEWYWSGSMDAFANMCKLRLDPHAQYEARIAAKQISDTLATIWPVSWNALMECDNVNS